MNRYLEKIASQHDMEKQAFMDLLSSASAAGQYLKDTGGKPLTEPVKKTTRAVANVGYGITSSPRGEIASHIREDVPGLSQVPGRIIDTISGRSNVNVKTGGKKKVPSLFARLRHLSGTRVGTKPVPSSGPTPKPGMIDSVKAGWRGLSEGSRTAIKYGTGGLVVGGGATAYYLHKKKQEQVQNEQQIP